MEVLWRVRASLVGGPGAACFEGEDGDEEE